MRRKLILSAAILFSAASLSAQDAKVSSSYETHRQHAIQTNELAGHIESVEDAHRLVDLVAAEFSAVLPPRWTTRGLRNRIARAEYESAADPGALIPEQRMADAWNDFLEKIGAPEESHVTSDEIHTLRDSHYVSAQMLWARGIQNIWSMPNVYAVGEDGKVADGCRALEAMSILWDLDSHPDNLRRARELIKKGVLLSDTIKEPAKPPAPGQVSGTMKVEFHSTTDPIMTNPVDVAARQYMRDHGASAMNHAVQELLNDLFPR